MKKLILVVLVSITTHLALADDRVACQTTSYGVTSCSNGMVGNTVSGGQTVWSNGVVATPNGYGGTNYSNGASSQTYGNQTTYSNGKVCVNNNGIISCR